MYGGFAHTQRSWPGSSGGYDTGPFPCHCPICKIKNAKSLNSMGSSISIWLNVFPCLSGLNFNTSEILQFDWSHKPQTINMIIEKHDQSNDEHGETWTQLSFQPAAEAEPEQQDAKESHCRWWHPALPYKRKESQQRPAIDFAFDDQFIQRTPCCKHDEVYSCNITTRNCNGLNRLAKHPFRGLKVPNHDLATQSFAQSWKPGLTCSCSTVQLNKNRQNHYACRKCRKNGTNSASKSLKWPVHRQLRWGSTFPQFSKSQGMLGLSEKSAKCSLHGANSVFSREHFIGASWGFFSLAPRPRRSICASHVAKAISTR